MRSLILIASCALLASAQTNTRNVILVTADGLRWQDLFNGMDPLLMSEASAGMEKASDIRNQFRGNSSEEAREKLLPFFWGKLARTGVVLGNVKTGSSVRISNAYRVSYPGYSEILTGRAQDDIIRGNIKIQNPTVTVLEFVRSKLNLSRNKVALFASWDVFPYIGETKQGSITINAGYQNSSESPRMQELSSLQFQMRTPWDSVRHDQITTDMALDHIRRNQPRLVHIALGEMDDWAHDRRYDRVLTSIHAFDHNLQQIWSFVSQHPQYRHRTTLIVTSDHGRGSKLADWHSHGKDVAGAEDIWLAIFGPDIAAKGEVSVTEPVLQRDVSPTILKLFGLDYREYSGVQGIPLPSKVWRAP